LNKTSSIYDSQGFQLLANTLLQLVWMIDLLGKLTYVNQTWIDYTGQTNATAQSQAWVERIHPAEQTDALQAWYQAVPEQNAFELECRIASAQGAYKWWLLNLKPMFDASNVVCGWIGICTNIHKRKLLEQQQSANIEQIQATNVSDNCTPF
jgi:PAS domain S-box-containing protein